MISRGRLLDAWCVPARGERVEELVRFAHVAVEQILTGPLDGPVDYLQPWDELVVVLAGSALLEVDGEAVELGTGEWLLLPAAVPHRLIRADPGTNWLAVHGRDSDSEA